MWEKQWHTWSSRNWEKVICEKNNGTLCSWLYAWAILSNETAQNVRSAELVFFLSNLRLLEGMGLALRPKAISRNTIYICYNFQNEIIFQKDRKNRPIKNVFRFWISDCIKLKYSSVNNIIMESKLLWSQVDILIHPDFILRIIRTVERMPLLDLGISLKSNYRISLNNE